MGTGSELTIRQAGLDDHVQACALLDSLHGFHSARAPWMFAPPGVDPDPRARLAALLACDDNVLFVAVAVAADATAGHEIVGVAHGTMRNAPVPRIFAAPRWGVLEGLVVAPAWRRHGIGRRLTEAIESWAHARGAPWVELNVYDFNADARRFYESLGYLPLSTKLRKPGPGAG